MENLLERHDLTGLTAINGLNALIYVLADWLTCTRCWVLKLDEDKKVQTGFENSAQNVVVDIPMLG